MLNKSIQIEKLLEDPEVQKATGNINLEVIERRNYRPPVCEVFTRPYTELREDDQYRFSIHPEALNCLAHIQKGNWKKVGLEREASDAIANRLGKAPQGFFVPTEIGWSQRDMTVGSATAGGNLKGVDHLGDRFIDALRAKSIIFDLGARRMSGLRGDVAIPALNAKTTAYWVAENAAPPISPQERLVFPQINFLDL